jgi:tRNA pseudouridine38-40 synthase
MTRFKLTIEYQGTRYSGWQVQRNAHTVQGEIQAAVARATGLEDFELCGAGRTDAGVHALRQVAHLDLKTSVPAPLLRLRFNDELPADIHILALESAHPRFHARHHAIGRSYLYQISRRRTAFGKKLLWWVREELDLERMRAVAALFVGMKDYHSFCARDAEDKSTKVLIERVQLGENGDLILIRVEGSHFLWKMVRRMVGVIVEAGRGRLSPEEAAAFFHTRTDRPAKLAAPGSGLFLERVYYEGDQRLERLDPVIHINP